MSISKNLAVLMTITAGILIANSVQAAALYSTTATPGRNNYSDYLGIGFVPTSNLLVTALGFIDDEGDGNTNPNGHPVQLWQELTPTTGTLLASATVQTGGASPLTNGFRYETLVTPILLFAGTRYSLVASVVSGDGDAWGDNNTFGYTFTLPINTGSIDGRLSFGGGPSGFPQAYGPVGVDFYQAPNLIATVVPEPTGLTLALFGIVGLSRSARKRA